MTVLANLMSYSGTLGGETVITFPMKAKTLTIYNRETSKTMTFKFNTSENAVTLEPTEVVEFPELSIRTLILTGSNVSYKVVALG